jgi:hypothetical protein
MRVPRHTLEDRSRSEIDDAPVPARRIKAGPMGQTANRNLFPAMFPYDAALLRVRSQPANFHSTLCERWCGETGEFARPAYGGDRRRLYGLFSRTFESLRFVHNFSMEPTSELAMNPHEDSVPFGSCEPIIFGGGTRFEPLRKSRLQAGGCGSEGAQSANSALKSVVS